MLSFVNISIFNIKKVKKVKAGIALTDTPSQSYMGSHSVTCQPTQVNAPRLTPATMQAGTRFTCPGGMEG